MTEKMIALALIAPKGYNHQKEFEEAVYRIRALTEMSDPDAVKFVKEIYSKGAWVARVERAILYGFPVERAIEASRVPVQFWQTSTIISQSSDVLTLLARYARRSHYMGYLKQIWFAVKKLW